MKNDAKPSTGGEDDQGDDPEFSVGPDQLKELLASGNPALIEAMQRGLARMIGQSSGYIESLPASIRTRIAYLENLQEEYDELENKFEEELKALEEKYKKAYAPIYEKRREIITGEADAPENETEEGKKAIVEAGDEAQKGIPEFWLIAMRNHPEIEDMITEKDAEVLKHLVDIRVEDMYDEDGDDEGFRLTFSFSENSFMTNKELTLTYLVVEEGGYVSVRDIEGCKVNWHADKDVTVKKLKKKPKAGSKAKPVVKVENVASFFRLFSPPVVPDEEEDDDEEDEEDDEDMDALREEVENHMAIGEVFREQLVPHAVEWFTGVAAAEMEAEEEEDDYDDDDDIEEEDDDDDEDENDEGGPKDKQDPAECKQQ